MALRDNHAGGLHLSTACLALIAIATLFSAHTPDFAQLAEAKPEFEVASVKRNLSGSRPWLVPPVGGRFAATNIPLRMLIGVGWRQQKSSGGPPWVDTDGYDVSAIAPEPDPSRERFSLMMQTLLEDRFSLRVHTETHDARVYVLLPGKNGLKLPDANSVPCVYGWKSSDFDPQTGCGGMNVTSDSIVDEKVAMQWFTNVLASMIGAPVQNETGFNGTFKVRLEFTPIAPGLDADSTKPSIFAALEEQLGLRLESRKGTEPVLIIDHVDRPSAN
jgi:uncharacterized protein (TIGR03435 family)